MTTSFVSVKSTAVVSSNPMISVVETNGIKIATYSNGVKIYFFHSVAGGEKRSTWKVKALDQLVESIDADMEANPLESEDFDLHFTRNAIINDSDYLLGDFVDHWGRDSITPLDSRINVDLAAAHCGMLEEIGAVTLNYGKTIGFFESNSYISSGLNNQIVGKAINKALKVLTSWTDNVEYKASDETWFDLCIALGLAHFVYHHCEWFSKKVKSLAAQYFMKADYISRVLCEYLPYILYSNNEYNFEVLKEELSWAVQRKI